MFRKPAGAKVVATCAGKDCQFKRKQAKAPKGVVDLTKLFSGCELAANVLIRLQVTAPGRTGQTIELKTRAGKPPRSLSAERDLAVATGRPQGAKLVPSLLLQEE